MWSLDPLTAGITAAVGIGLILMAWYQLSHMVKTSKARLLEQLDVRWSTPPMTGARRKANELIRAVEATHREKPLEERNLREAADFTAQLTALREDVKATDDYLSLMEICSFFETVGFAVNRTYVDFRDIYELYGGSILGANTLFSPYLESQQRKLREQGLLVEAKKHYEYFSWLVEKVMSLVAKTRTAEPS